MEFEQQGAFYQQEIPVAWTDQDHEDLALQVSSREITFQQFRVHPVIRVKKVSLEEIINFCGRCELFDEGVCILDKKPWTNQTRYVARKYCGWAKVDGQYGEMTESGFHPAP